MFSLGSHIVSILCPVIDIFMKLGVNMCWCHSYYITAGIKCSRVQKFCAMICEKYATFIEVIF
jgi:hypothetical protein